MYKINVGQNRIREELQLEKPDGETLKINVDINIDRIGGKVYNALLAVNEAEKAPEKEKYDKTGSAILKLFVLIFGENDTEKIIKLYDNQPLDMLSDLLPFITERILPQVIAVSAAKKKQFLQSAKTFNR